MSTPVIWDMWDICNVMEIKIEYVKGIGADIMTTGWVRDWL